MTMIPGQKTIIEQAVKEMARAMFGREPSPADLNRYVESANHHAELEYDQFKKQMLTEMADLEAKGKGRQAIGIVARRHARSAGPRSVDSLKRKLRRWRAKLPAPR